MSEAVMNVIIATVGVLLTGENYKRARQGAARRGKIARAVGPFGALMLSIACASLVIGGLFILIFLDQPFFLRAGTALLIILAADDFFNGDDPPTKRRRARLKNRLMRLAPARSGN